MSKATLIKEADRLFGAWFHSTQRFCSIEDCGDPHVEMAHLIPKINYLWRWDKRNVLPLCPFHHKYSRLLSAHGSPDAFEEWLANNRQEQYEFFITNRHKIANSIPESYFKAVVEDLKSW